jgi:hypothetical protein
MARHPPSFRGVLSRRPAGTLRIPARWNMGFILYAILAVTLVVNLAAFLMLCAVARRIEGIEKYLSRRAGPGPQCSHVSTGAVRR